MGLRLGKVRPKLLLFDLGGVLIDVDASTLRELAGAEKSTPELWETWLTCKAVEEYESGHINNEDFARGVLAAFGSSMHPTAFLESFTRWPIGFFDGVPELLVDLKRNYKLAFLSNSNPLHYPRFQNEWHVDRYFDYQFASHLMGSVKPKPEIFTQVIQAVNLAPGEITFFDDNRLNVEAARRAGLLAHTVRGITALRETLDAHGLR